LAPGFVYAPFNDLAAADALIDVNTAGFLLEPIQGEGGIMPATDAFLKGLRALADKHGLLLVLDEVQAGYGRTGKFFAHEHYGITPDIMAVAKGIGGGFPLGACLATEKAAAGMVIGTHGSTYGGGPLAMAAGQAVLDVILADGFLEQVTAMGARLEAAINQLIPNHDHLFDHVRGKGLMLGIKLKSDSRAFVAHARDHHNLLTVAAADNVVRVLPPLIIEEAHIAEFIEKLSAAAADYQAPAS
ncbi:MAG: aminotransferase class III-fold pyridoxal phosphate-dependent enzyme, partial [Alphaproteobacteria bacterium]|nr:aminotransferase class III-fold pyridoxal phosphate-dependent enzyme [Alphaproteobacteria bacterium]